VTQAVGRGRGKPSRLKDRSFASEKRSDPVSASSQPADRPVSLIELLRRRLAQVDEATNATWAERLIEAWIIEALKGNFRALQEILNRVEGERVVDGETHGGALAVDEQTAAKILEALCEETDNFPSD
jgi:hypothetical protein